MENLFFLCFGDDTLQCFFSAREREAVRLFSKNEEAYEFTKAEILADENLCFERAAYKALLEKNRQ